MTPRNRTNRRNAARPFFIRAFIPPSAGAVLAFVAALLAAPPPAHAQPAIEVVGGKTLDLDTLYRGQVVERIVTLKNTGNMTLQIGEVLSSCGCTGTVISTDRIDPGAAGSLKVTFDAKSASGPVRKKITVKSNDPNHPATVIDLTAIIVQELEVNPQSFWFKDAEVGRATTVTTTLRNAGKVPVTLLKATIALEGLSVLLPNEAIPPGTQVTITATLTAVKEMPIISDGVRIATSSPRQPEVYIPVFGTAKQFKFN
jgi:hypothetical protein